MASSLPVLLASISLLCISTSLVSGARPSGSQTTTGAHTSEDSQGPFHVYRDATGKLIAEPEPVAEPTEKPVAHLTKDSIADHGWKSVAQFNKDSVAESREKSVAQLSKDSVAETKGDWDRSAQAALAHELDALYFNEVAVKTRKMTRGVRRVLRPEDAVHQWSTLGRQRQSMDAQAFKGRQRHVKARSGI